MVISHEQGIPTKFLGLGSLELIFGNFPQFLELRIINYELITNYQILTIKSAIYYWIKLFYIFILDIKFEFKL
jgi:hypothetical protein